MTTEPSLTLSGSTFTASDQGRVLESAEGKRYRILSVAGHTAQLVEIPELPWLGTRRSRLWRFLTTAPNGDATRWMA